ncbi:hypothetical protein Tco_0824200 [Tanacetum coccineum]|uniref:MAK10-like protein n=1 Tax=Tanacetum coccineum TaxID=301880 RepID=A0ABQ5AP49_9ASTR
MASTFGSKNSKESWALLEDLALYDNESWNNPGDFAKPVKAITLPQDVLSTFDRRLIELENQVHLMEAHLAPMQPTQVNKVTTPSTANAVIDCRKAKIAIGEGITRLVSRVKGIELGQEEAPYWTILEKRESYKPRPSSDGVGAITPYYARKDFLDCHFPVECE